MQPHVLAAELQEPGAGVLAMTRVFIRFLRFLIDNAIWIACVFSLIMFSISMHRHLENIKQEAREQQELLDAISEVCELTGNVWSSEENTCHSPSSMRRIHQHRPTVNGLI